MTKRKTRAHYKKSSKTKSAPINWLLAGVLLGLIIPGIFYLKSHSSSSSSLANINLQSSDEEKKVVHTTTHVKNVAKKEVANKAHYEFYNVLSSEKENPTTEHFTLAISAYDNYEAADQLKAQLLLLGFDHIHIINTKKGAHPSYSVVAGPFTTRVAATKLQKQLKENSIQSSLVVE